MNVRPVKFGNVTGLHTRSTYTPDYGALARHRLATARSAAGLSPSEFAARLTPLVRRPVNAGHVMAWETSTTPPADVVFAAMSLSPSASARLGVRSHKFIAAHIGHEPAQRLTERAEMVAATEQSGCWTSTVADAPDHCDLYVWPYGTALYHLVEELDLPDITNLALWRYQSYPQNLEWVTGQLRELVEDDQIEAAYVLSVYWVHAAPWIGAGLDSALRLICSPRVLVDRELRDIEANQVSGERVEQQLIAEGFNPPDMRSFGVKGVSNAYASWSGVVYHPHDTDRGLMEDDLISFEIGLQAIWSYTAFINAQIEQGIDPTVDARYGYTFLRSMRSRLLTARPQETNQHTQMRSAIVETSGLPSQLALAMETLKEIEGR